MTTSAPTRTYSYFVFPADRDRIFMLGCEVSTTLQECMNRREQVIDPGQFLYDWVRTRVKTRQDYVLYTNTLHGCLDYGHFLRLERSGTEARAYQKIRTFVADVRKELNTLADEKNFKPASLLSAQEVARQVKLQIESIPITVLNAGLTKMDLTATEYLHSELAMLAQHNGYTLEEYLGPTTHNDLSAPVAFIRTVDTQFKNTAEKVMVENPEAHVFEHFKFLAQLFQDFASNGLLRTELKRAIMNLGAKSRWPMVGAAAQRAVGGHNPILDAEFLGMLNLEPVK